MDQELVKTPQQLLVEGINKVVNEGADLDAIVAQMDPYFFQQLQKELPEGELVVDKEQENVYYYRGVELRVVEDPRQLPALPNDVDGAANDNEHSPANTFQTSGRNP